MNFQVWQNIGWDFLTLSPYEKTDISNLLFKNDQWQQTHDKTKIPTWLLTRNLKFNTDPYNLSQLFFPPKFKSTVIENLSFILVSLLDHKCNLNQVRNHPLKKWPILFQLRPLAQNIFIDLALNNIAQKDNSSKQTIPYKGMKLKKRKTFETLIMLIF